MSSKDALLFFTMLLVAALIVMIMLAATPKAHAQIVTPKIPFVTTLNPNTICFGGFIFDSLHDGPYDFYFCEGRTSHDKEYYWYEGYRDLIKLSPKELKKVMGD